MEEEYMQINLSRDEAIKLFETLGMNTCEESFTEQCFNEKCEDFDYVQTDGYEMGTVLTNDKHVITSFCCNTCKEVTVTATPGYYYFANLGEE